LPRIPLLSEDGLSPEQRRVYNKVVAGPRGAVVGPLRAALHSPELADRWQAFGEQLRYHTSLSHKLKELAVIMAGRHWNCSMEWAIHADIARRAGLPEALIESIQACAPPVFDEPDEAIVYEYTRETLQCGDVSEAAYQAAYHRFGAVGVVELTAVIGYYSLVAMTLNSHDIPVPRGLGDALPVGGGAGRGKRPPAKLAPAQALAQAEPT
jgi:4-carboxymuconolactone decarboxylase